MYNNVMNRGLFRRYARQPQAPQAPSGIMASSPELMQTAMRYQQGGMVQPPVAQPRVNPQFRPDLMRFQEGGNIDITQAPTEFKLTNARGQPIRGAITETPAEQPVGGRNAPGSPMSGAGPKEEPVVVDEVDEAIATGEAVLSGKQQVDPSIIPDELSGAAGVLGNPESTDSEVADAITDALGKGKGKGTKGKIQALKDTISDVFGVDASRYDSLKALNRAAVGFSIARGDDIADALAKGVQGAAAIESQQLAREDKMSEMALQQAFAEKVAGIKAAGSGTGARKFSPTEAYDDQVLSTARTILQNSPPGTMTFEQALSQAQTAVSGLPAYSGGAGSPPPTEGGGLKAPPPATLKQAQEAIAGGADKAAVVKRLEDNGYSAEGL